MRPELRGLKGGDKQMYLRHHRTEILEHYAANGLDATLEEYNLKKKTFERFLIVRSYNDQRLTKAERALDISKQAIESARENKRRLRQLEERLDDLEPALIVANGFMMAAVRVARDLPEISGYGDGLFTLADIVGSRQKRD